MKFEFATAARILFGPGSSAQLPELAAAVGRRVFLITGSSGAPYNEMTTALVDAGLDVERHIVSGEPEVGSVETVLTAARKHNPEVLIGIGGGSVLDTGKIVAALLTNPGELADYLEVVGRGSPITNPPIPYCAVPTTAGTGTEVTRNAVIGVPEHRVKVSVRSRLMLPRHALVDPELTISTPPHITAATGLDACTQLIESYVGCKANPLTDGICREGLLRAGRSLRTVYLEPENRAAREDMALAALMSGICLANAKLGAVHGLAGPLGGLISAPHGELCARLLGPVTRANLAALQTQDPENLALVRYRQAAQLLMGRSEVQPGDLVDWVLELSELMKIPSLSALGLTPELVSEAVAKAQCSSSMQGNPIELSDHELSQILNVGL